MTRNEFVLKTAEMIMKDWRKVLLANEESKMRFNLPGDTVDISFRAFQKAETIADQFYDCTP